MLSKCFIFLFNCFYFSYGCFVLFLELFNIFLTKVIGIICRLVNILHSCFHLYIFKRFLIISILVVWFIQQFQFFLSLILNFLFLLLFLLLFLTFFEILLLQLFKICFFAGLLCCLMKKSIVFFFWHLFYLLYILVLFLSTFCFNNFFYLLLRCLSPLLSILVNFRRIFWLFRLLFRLSIIQSIINLLQLLRLFFFNRWSCTLLIHLINKCENGIFVI